LLNIVQAKDDYFEPAVITVRAGQFVQWINQGKYQHTVTQGLCPNGICTATPGGFNSGVLSPGGTTGFQFNQLGTFAYFCQIHGARMTGSVAVTP
jgi:plastocyanin